MVTLLIFVGIVLAIYLVWYSIFASSNPDLLRSERFSIRKMEIERGLVGDATSGMQDLENVGPVEQKRITDSQSTTHA